MWSDGFELQQRLRSRRRGIPGAPGTLPGGAQRMSEHVYKTIELTGSSKKGIEQAVENALTRAAETVRSMRWFQLTETRGYIEKGKIAYWQVTLKIGFTLE